VSFWECKPRVTSFQIWFARRRRKPPDKFELPFQFFHLKMFAASFDLALIARGHSMGPRDGVTKQRHLEIPMSLRKNKQHMARTRSLPFVSKHSFSQLIVAFVLKGTERAHAGERHPRTLGDVAISRHPFSRRFERLPDSSSPDPATRIPNHIEKSPRRGNVAIGIIAGHRAKQCR